MAIHPHRQRRWPIDSHNPEVCGLYPCENRPHEFLKNGSGCWLCFGDREDPRHWLPVELQEISDRWVEKAVDEILKGAKNEECIY